MKVEIITKCPSCNSFLDRVKDQLFCRNDSCEAKSDKKVLHFAKTLKIRGLGEKTIEKLNISHPLEIYELSEDDIKSKLGDKLGAKLFLEIEKSKQQNIEVLLSSFGIDLIGASASKKIASVTKDIASITPELCKEAGLGDKATTNLTTWLENNPWIRELPISITQTPEETKVESDRNLTVCISGKIDNYTKSSATKLLESHGIRCVSAVSSKVDYLICNDINSSSSKANKARELNIEIIPFENFLKKENIVNE